MRRGWHMYEYETEENIKRLIGQKTGQRVVKFISRTSENKEMQVLLANGMRLKAQSHIEMKRLLEKPKDKGLIN